uniref:Uncharacterized protein n=1 Tax=Arion vulgaris TaxID=1028688 RepID=A0A0B7BKA1_9EUPU
MGNMKKNCGKIVETLWSDVENNCQKCSRMATMEISSGGLMYQTGHTQNIDR